MARASGDVSEEMDLCLDIVYLPTKWRGLLPVVVFALVYYVVRVKVLSLPSVTSGAGA